jgi:Patatin-like phospholipase
MKKRPRDEIEPRPRPVSTVAGALWREFEAIHGEVQSAALGQGPDASLLEYNRAALAKDQAALCLSGGGIRSGSFVLGVLRALAKQGLLSRFHYLSTVSGGGYIGGWLLSMLANHDGDVEMVQALLAADVAPPEMRELRRHTSFLAPHFGLFDPGTWAGVALWVRNVLINWAIFLPAFLALAVLPGLYNGLLTATQPGGLNTLLLCVALLSLFVAVWNGTTALPSHSGPAGWSRPGAKRFVIVGVVIPAVIWAWLVPLVVAPWLRPVMPDGAISGDIVPLLNFVVIVAAAVVPALRKGLERDVFWHNFAAWTIAALVASVALWVWLDLAIGLPTMAVATLGPLAMSSAHVTLTLVFVALRIKAWRGDLDREWLARLSAEKLAPALIWAVFAAVCLVLPVFVLDDWNTRFKPLVLGAWMAAGPAGAVLGKLSNDMPGTNPGAGKASFLPSLALLTNAIAIVFAVLIFMLLGELAARMTGGNPCTSLIVLAVSLLLAFGLGHRINVNRFSMHAVYRNRLVQGFLGTARPVRRPEPFTGIDPADNARMSEMFHRHPACRTLYPVINVTLNLVSGRDPAWSERKAESFTITPFACGGAWLHRSEDIAAGLPARGAYVTTTDYAGDERETGRDDPGRGITLGTAMTISGAAVSPSMGYHSSPATAFLMTLFNVRLGAWLPNPAIAPAALLERARPPNALLSLARELLGLTNDLGSDVYLSDGGHFEDLGLYEMIRRRCRLILVVDGDQDPDAQFEDLGNAVRKIRIDFDVRIDFDPPVAIGSRRVPVTPFCDFACATIRYPDIGAQPGYLIYLKPSWSTDVPIDVRSYGNMHDEFPHESTIDQFFTESQFESYRQLGETEAGRLAPDAMALAAFFEAVRNRINHQ